MPKYEGWKKIIVLSIPEVGQKQDMLKEEERAKVTDYNGQYLSPELKGDCAQTVGNDKRKLNINLFIWSLSAVLK